MARATAVTNTVIYGPNVGGEVTANAVTASTAFYVEADQLDERTVFVYTPGSASGAITVTAGTGYAGTKDLTIDAAKADTGYAFTLDSARFAIASGENAGLIKFTPTKTGTFAVIQPKV